MDQNERNELAEDQEKLQLALQEVSNENDDWYDYDDVEEEEDEPLLIDLDAPSDITGQSSSICVDGRPGGHFMTIDDDSQDRRPIPDFVAGPSQTEKPSGSTVEKTLALNKALQGILETRIDSIQEALESNKEKQDNLNEGKWADMESKSAGKGKTFGPFRSPFFNIKDANTFPPENEDSMQKKQSNELSYALIMDHMSYNRSTKKALLKAVGENTREHMMKPVMNKFESELKKALILREKADEANDAVVVLETQLKEFKAAQKKLLGQSMADPDVVKANQQEILECQKEIEAEKEKRKTAVHDKTEQDKVVAQVEKEFNSLKNLSDDDVLKRVDSSKVDWMKVSKQWFKEGTTWLDCKKAWDFIADPNINLKPWKKEEEAKLVNYVRHNGPHDWETIANHVGTGRTAFHCFYHFQNRYNPDFRSRKWTKEEDSKLLQAVKKMSECTNYFSWGRVSTLVNSRSSSECYRRHGYISNDRKMGRWSSLEDARLVMAVDTLGENYSKVSKFLGKRTPSQCRLRYTHCLNPELNFLHFTYDEDKRLLQLHKELGPQWVKVAGHFKGRTDAMVKQRFITLKKWRKETEWFNSLNEKEKNLLLGRNLTVVERRKHMGEWRQFYEQQLGVLDRDYARREEDLRHGTDLTVIPPRPPMHFKYKTFQNGHLRGTHWTNRLNLHQKLLENLKKRVAENNWKSVAKKTRGEQKEYEINEMYSDDEERLKEITDKTIEETAMDGIKLPSDKEKHMMAALNSHFLGTSNINVSDIIKSVDNGENRMDKRLNANCNRKKINKHLKMVLARNNWIYKKRNCLQWSLLIPPHDRTICEVETEEEDWEKAVVGFMMKRLGGDSFSLKTSVENKHLKAKEKRDKIMEPSEDDEYLYTVKVLTDKIAEVEAADHLLDEVRDRFIKKLYRKMKDAKRFYRKSYKQKRLLMDSLLEESNRDIEFIDNYCISSIGDGGLMSHISISQAIQTYSGELTPQAFAATTSAMFGSMSYENESPDVSYGSLVFLPPSRTTLTALRSLLLHRQNLVEKAGKLYHPCRYDRKRKREIHIIWNEVEEEKEKEDETNEGKRSKKPKASSVEVVEIVDNSKDDGTVDQAFTDIQWMDRYKEKQNKERSSLYDLLSFKSKQSAENDDQSFVPYIPSKWKRANVFSTKSKKLEDKDKTVKGNDLKMLETITIPERKFFAKKCTNQNKTMYEVVIAPTIGAVYHKGVSKAGVSITANTNTNYSAGHCTITNANRHRMKSNAKTANNCLKATSKGTPDGFDHKLSSDGNEITSRQSSMTSNLEVQGQDKTIVIDDDEEKGVIVEAASCSSENTSVQTSAISEQSSNTTVEQPSNTSVTQSSNTSVTQSSNMSAEQSSNTSFTQSSNMSVTQLSNMSVTQSSNMSVTQLSNMSAEQSSNASVTQSSNTSVTQSSNTPFTQSSNTSVTQSSNTSATQSSKMSAELSSNMPGTQLSNTPATQTHNTAAHTLTVTEQTNRDKCDVILDIIEGEGHCHNIVDTNTGESVAVTAGQIHKDEVSLTVATDHNQIGHKNSVSDDGNTLPTNVVIDGNDSVKSVDTRCSLTEINSPYLSVSSKSKASSTLSKALEQGEEGVVVVGLDNDGKIVHYPNSPPSKVLPKRPICPSPPVEEKVPEPRLIVVDEENVDSCMATIRRTQDYQRLLARFRALFMWPVLMSTTVPTKEVTVQGVDERSRTSTSTECLHVESAEPPQFIHKRGRGRKKKRQNRNSITNAVNNQETEDTEPKRPKRKRKRKDYSQGFTMKEGLRDRRLLSKIYTSPTKKPRQVRANAEIPSWWKDAITETMVVKKKIEDGQMKNEEVSIFEDEDFIDKGDYSDDEWVTQLKEEERQKYGESSTAKY